MGDDSIDTVISHIDMGYLVILLTPGQTLDLGRVRRAGVHHCRQGRVLTEPD